MAESSFFGGRFSPVSALLLALSIAMGLTFPFVHDVSGPVVGVIAKGMGVGLLAVAALRLRALDRLWLAAIMGAGALGDVLLELHGLFFIGAGFFAVGHCIAMAFYVRNGGGRTRLERLLALGLIGWGLAMPALVTPPETPVGALMLYSVLLCGMAAALLLSRFPRIAVLGALLFVVSDTLLIMRLGGGLVGAGFVHGLLVWYSYYVGQALIFVGIAMGLPLRVAR